jgi:hypothetical protein
MAIKYFMWTTDKPALKLLSMPPGTCEIRFGQVGDDVRKLWRKCNLPSKSYHCYPKSEEAQDKVIEFLDGLEPLGFIRRKSPHSGEYDYQYVRGGTTIDFCYRSNFANGLCAIDGVTDESQHESYHKFLKIMNKYGKMALTNPLKEVMWKCQQELIDNGLEGNAKW